MMRTEGEGIGARCSKGGEAMLRWTTTTVSLWLVLGVASGLAGQAIQWSAGGGVGGGALDGRRVAAFAITAEYPVFDGLTLGVRYGTWHWDLGCFVEVGVCASGKTLTLEGRHEFGVAGRVFRPFLGAGVGGMQWGIREESDATGAVFGGVDLNWRVLSLRLELRHQTQGLYTGYDPITGVPPVWWTGER